MSDLKPTRKTTPFDGNWSVPHAKFYKTHYEFIANLFWQAYNDPEVISIAQLDSLLVEFIHAFEQDNPNFDRRKFEKAARSFQ